MSKSICIDDIIRGFHQNAVYSRLRINHFTRSVMIRGEIPMRIQTVLSITLALATGALAQPYAAWGKYKEIAVNTKASGANVAGTVTNIPVLIRLNASNAADIFTGP